MATSFLQMRTRWRVPRADEWLTKYEAFAISPRSIAVLVTSIVSAALRSLIWLFAATRSGLRIGGLKQIGPVWVFCFHSLAHRSRRARSSKKLDCRLQWNFTNNHSFLEAVYRTIISRLVLAEPRNCWKGRLRKSNQSWGRTEKKSLFFWLDQTVIYSRGHILILSVLICSAGTLFGPRNLFSGEPLTHFSDDEWLASGFKLLWKSSFIPLKRVEFYAETPMKKRWPQNWIAARYTCMVANQILLCFDFWTISHCCT